METMTETEITVEIGWSETVAYKSTIKLDIAAIREWQREWAPEGEEPADDEPITDEIVNDYLNEAEDAEWFEQCDTDADFVSVDSRGLDHNSAEIVTENEGAPAVTHDTELVGFYEAAALLGVSKTTLNRRIASGSVPEPVSRLRMGPVWRADDIKALIGTVG